MSHETLEPTSVISEPPRSASIGTFRALRHRDYRYLWLGQMGHGASLWMEQVVRPLLVLQLTGSALQVGLIIAARTVPMFTFGLVAGVVADHYDKRRVLMYTQFVALLMQLIMGLLIVTGHIQLWHVYATAIIAGAATSFTQPARQSLVPRYVPREELVNALALTSAAMNLMRVAGAGLAGLLLILFDYGEVYLLDAVIYAGAIWTTLQMSAPQEVSNGAQSKRHGSLMKEFAEGFSYINKNRAALYLVGMALILFVLGQPYQQVFVPILAINVLDIGRSGAGWMLALTGVGALIGSLTVATWGNLPHRGLLMMGLLVLFSLALILLSLSGWVPLSAVALILAGGMTTAYMALNNSLLLEQAPPQFHGRIMSLMSLDRGMISIGAILSGAMAELLGPQLGLTVLAGVCLGLTILLFLLVPALRRMK